MEILAYNVVSKKKEQMLNAVIDRNGKKCFAKGQSATGQKLCVAIGLANAEKAVDGGFASKGSGWEN